MAAASLKPFDHEWIFDAFAGRSTFFTKRMFGGLAAYVHERQMLVLVQPTKTGRWKWHGVLVCTGQEHHASIRAEFPVLMPHAVLRKWLYIDSAHEDFEPTMEAAIVAAGLLGLPGADLIGPQPRTIWSLSGASRGRRIPCAPPRCTAPG